MAFIVYLTKLVEQMDLYGATNLIIYKDKSLYDLSLMFFLLEKNTKVNVALATCLLKPN